MAKGLVSRRAFLWAGGAGAVGLFAQQARAAVRFTYHLSDNFSVGEKKILSQAVNIVADRLCEEHVYRNACSFATGGDIAAGYPEKIGLDPKKKEDLDRLHNLWSSQLRYYLPSVKSPDVHLYRSYEVSKYAGEVKPEDLGGVVTKYGARKEEDIAGEFKIYLNAYQFGEGRIGSDAANWASVIAHEMMHCLGHIHKKDQYVDWLQINAVQFAVYTNGKYKRGGKLPAFA